MSWAFIAALKKNPQQSYIQLLNSIRAELEAKYTQKPQLSCSHPLSEFAPFLSVMSVDQVGVEMEYGANSGVADTNLLYVM